MLLLRLTTTVLVAIAVVVAAESPSSSTEKAHKPTSASSESRNGEIIDQIAEESSRVSEVIEAQEKSYANSANPPPPPPPQPQPSVPQGPPPIPVPIPVQVRPGALVLPSPGRNSGGNKPPNYDNNYGPQVPPAYAKLQDNAPAPSSLALMQHQQQQQEQQQQQGNPDGPKQRGPPSQQQQQPPQNTQNQPNMPPPPPQGQGQFAHVPSNGQAQHLKQQFHQPPINQAGQSMPLPSKNYGPQMIPPQLQGLPLAQLMPPQLPQGPRPFGHPMLPQQLPAGQNFAQLQSQRKHNNVPNEDLQQKANFQHQQEVRLQPSHHGSEFGELGVAVVPMGASNFPGFPNAISADEQWQRSNPEMPQILHLEAKCEKNQMKVAIKFDKPFFGVIFSKGNYDNEHCVYMRPGKGLTSATFDIAINGCGTTGNTQNGLYGYGEQSGSGSYFENTVVVQYDPLVQEVWDQARKLRCSWHDYYEKSVTFKPFNVEMLDIVHTEFAGDNVGCWMQIQVGKGPWANEVSGIVKIGQTMTMVLAIKDDENKFDMLVRDCVAHDGKRTPIDLVDDRGCIVRPKLMSKFTKIKNFGTSASVMSYAHFQAFKFPDSMDVHFQCTIQICRYQCPEQCAQPIEGGPARGAETLISENLQKSPALPYVQGGRPRLERRSAAAIFGRLRGRRSDQVTGVGEAIPIKAKSIGVDGNIKVVSSGDLAFNLDGSGGSNVNNTSATMVYPMIGTENSGLICISTSSFTATVIFLLAILVVSCIVSTFICLRNRSYYSSTSSSSTCSSSMTSTDTVHIKPKPMFYQFLGKPWKY